MTNSTTPQYTAEFFKPMIRATYCMGGQGVRSLSEILLTLCEGYMVSVEDQGPAAMISVSEAFISAGRTLAISPSSRSDWLLKIMDEIEEEVRFINSEGV